jgi:hypothetical protein
MGALGTELILATAVENADASRASDAHQRTLRRAGNRSRPPNVCVSRKFLGKRKKSAGGLFARNERPRRNRLSSRSQTTPLALERGV